MAMGTVYYMSPEQARGDALDARTDLFSLGSVLYEMATGRRAFEGDDIAQILGKITHGVFVPPRALNAGVPRALDAIIVKLLAADPQAAISAGQRPDGRPRARRTRRAAPRRVPLTAGDGGERRERRPGAAPDWPHPCSWS